MIRPAGWNARKEAEHDDTKEMKRWSTTLIDSKRSVIVREEKNAK